MRLLFSSFLFARLSGANDVQLGQRRGGVPARIAFCCKLWHGKDSVGIEACTVGA